MTKDDFEDQAMALADTLYRVSSMLLRRPQDRQDAMQSCLLRAWQHRHQLRERECFKPWMMRILVNECHTLLRKSRNMVLMDISQQQEAQAPDLALKHCVEALPLPLREVVALHYMEGWPVAEVAKALGIPSGTVKSRLSRAREQLRVQWKEEV